jgi:hypothetical protein
VINPAPNPMQGTVLIPQDEIRFNPASYADPAGSVFRWRDGLYRGISKLYEPRLRKLLEDRVLTDLAALGFFAGAEPTDLATKDFSFVLKLKAIDFVSYCPEWCPDMLKDAALMVLDLECELTRRGYSLIDVQPWNVLFEYANPRFVDLGSVQPRAPGESWVPYAQFLRFYVYPLIMMSRGGFQTARFLMRDHTPRIALAELQALFPPHAGSDVPALGPANDYASRLAAIQHLRAQVAAIPLALPDTYWANYDADYPDLVDQDRWDDKHRSALAALQRVKPKTVLDIASNHGWFSRLAANCGAEVVAFDVDIPSITKLYFDLRYTTVRVLPLIMDFENPTPAEGICYRWVLPATRRFACEMVMAIAIVHHLVFKSHLRFDQITDGLASFNGRHLLVEFIPADDVHVRGWWSPEYAWYTLDNFRAALSRHFSSIEILPSAPEPRVFLLCEK